MTASAHLDLDDEVLALLRDRRRQWKRIAEQSRLVSYSWISKFTNGRIDNAGVKTLRELRDWLVAHPEIASPAPTVPAPTGDGASQPSCIGAGSAPPG
ncbi:hypothetical protein [Ramlibacter sp.]|uniref:hypothetical protein n=1 Tax=Ramlibacter sp. TaxID=1917967 RepID=UPI003D0FF65C